MEMSQLLSFVVLLCLSLLCTTNCTNALNIVVKYEGIGGTQGTLEFTCHKGDKFVIRENVEHQYTEIRGITITKKSLKLTKTELNCSSESSLNLLTLATFADTGVYTVIEDRFVKSDQAFCAVYYPLHDFHVKEKKGQGVVLSLWNQYPDSKVEAYLLHLNKGRITHTTPVTDDTGVLENSVPVRETTSTAFTLRYKVGTYPDEMGCFGKLGRFIRNSKWSLQKPGSDSIFSFICGPSQPVKFDFEDDNKKTIVSKETAGGDLTTVLGYVQKRNNKFSFVEKEPNKTNRYCTIYVESPKFTVGHARLRRNINVVESGSEEKRGFRVFRRSLKEVS